MGLGLVLRRIVGIFGVSQSWVTLYHSKKIRAMGHQFEKHPRRHLFTGMYEVVIVAEFGAGLGFSNMAVSQM